MMNDVIGQLTQQERETVSTLLDIDEGVLDMSRSSTEVRSGFLICKFFAVEDECCPFELHFGRDDNERRFNFYVGLGAEFYNFEECSDAVCRREIAKDVDDFLKSEIKCERYETSKGVARALYVADRLSIDGEPVRLEYRGQSAFLARKQRREASYRPWIRPSD